MRGQAKSGAFSKSEQKSTRTWGRNCRALRRRLLHRKKTSSQQVFFATKPSGKIRPTSCVRACACWERRNPYSASVVRALHFLVERKMHRKDGDNAARTARSQPGPMPGVPQPEQSRITTPPVRTATHPDLLNFQSVQRGSTSCSGGRRWSWPAVRLAVRPSAQGCSSATSSTGERGQVETFLFFRNAF